MDRPDAAPAPAAPGEPRTLTDLLERVRGATVGEATGIGDILAHVGEGSFAPAILLPALLMVSPLSGMPGSPTVSAAVILLIALQWLWGRDHLWLPGVLMRRHIGSARVRRALDWLAGPARFVDRHTHRRLGLMAQGPARRPTILVICVIVVGWPMLELVPFVTSLGAFAVSLLAAGLMLRDGLYVLAGHAFVALLAASIWAALAA